jgi:hypothetical protein
MATMQQGTPPTVEPSETAQAGKRGDKFLNAMFAGPINRKSDKFASLEALRKDFETRVLSDNDDLKKGAINYGLGEWSPDYKGAPDLSTVETGPGGLPASPYVPNPASPGEGSTSPSDLPNPPEGFGLVPHDVPGSGVPITENNPKSASAKIAANRLGAYGLGRSS